MPAPGTARDEWWRSAVIYQVYIRSFADANGDGLGDVAGIRSKLPYLRDLGVDALWINPWYPSPGADAGYDVSDYRSIEPAFGTLEEAEALIAEAHDLGLKVLLDIVPNHTSDRHPWFQEALAAAPGSPARARYHFHDGRGPNGDERPNDWVSCFGGPAWTRTTNPDGTPGQWYLHLFAPEQPDLNWHHPDVRADFEHTLRFWFDRGADGFRIDVAHSLFKEDGLPDVAERSWLTLPFRLDPVPGVHLTDHPHWDREEIHDVYRAWREIADAYDPPRIFVAEAWVPDPSRTVRYLRADELHTAFNFDFLRCPWRVQDLRQVIDQTLAEHAVHDASATWVLENHDVARVVSRYARSQAHVTGHNLRDLPPEHDLEVGQRRARAASLLMLALPGCAYVYQGEELGLPEVEDIPEEALQDPSWERSGHADRGRDGCRVPLPWSTSLPSFGFGPENGAATWLPQPAWFGDYAASLQDGVPGSMLELFRAALRLRREHPALGEGDLAWVPVGDDALAFTREPGFGFLVNLGEAPVAVPDGWRVLFASGPMDGSTVPTDVAIWAQR